MKELDITEKTHSIEAFNKAIKYIYYSSKNGLPTVIITKSKLA